MHFLIEQIVFQIFKEHYQEILVAATKIIQMAILAVQLAISTLFPQPVTFNDRFLGNGLEWSEYDQIDCQVYGKDPVCRKYEHLL